MSGGGLTDSIMENTTAVYEIAHGVNGTRYVIELSASDIAYMMNGAALYSSGTDTALPVKIMIQNTAGGKWVLSDIVVRGI